MDEEKSWRILDVINHRHYIKRSDHKILITECGRITYTGFVTLMINYFTKAER